MLPLLNRIRTWWTNADRNQRVVTLGGIGALLLLLVGTAFFATRPHYDVLLENLSETEKNEAVEALKTANIPAEYGRAGVVEVPTAQIAEARMKLAAAGKLPSGPHHLSFPDLAKIGPMVSPEVESQTIKAILEGEIASTLETMEGVAAARVIITRPKETVFENDKELPSASVTLTEKGMGTLSPANGRMIANLVCSAVQGMKPEGVYVGTNSLEVLWDGHNSDMPSSKGDLDAQTARLWEGKIQSALDDVLGTRNTRVIVRADVDTTKKTTKLHEENPTDAPTASLKTVEDMANVKKNPGGIAGGDSNTAERNKAPTTPPDGGAGVGTSYKKKGTTEQFGNNVTDTTIEGGSGGLKALAITVAVNSEKISDVSGVEGIINGVMASDIEYDAAGVAKPNQKFTVKVQPFKFDGSAAVAAKEADDKRSSAARMQQIMSLLPIAAILVVALLVAKQVGKISRSVLPAAGPSEADETLAEGPSGLPSPEGAEQAALPMTRTAEEEHSILLEPIRDRVDIPLDSLKQMASERPEMVATLIKSMMLGDKA